MKTIQNHHTNEVRITTKLGYSISLFVSSNRAKFGVIGIMIKEPDGKTIIFDMGIEELKELYNGIKNILSFFKSVGIKQSFYYNPKIYNTELDNHTNDR